MMRVVAVVLSLVVALPLSAAPEAKQLFGAAKKGSTQRAAPLGSYAKGCAAGSVALPETGPTWQAMRLSRNRNWGHPTTIDFIQKLSAKAAQLPGWNGLYIGDISQPRGGPMLSGHRSHQIGLDIDIWMLPANNLKLSRREREKISSISLRRAKGAYINEQVHGPAHGNHESGSERQTHRTHFRVPRCKSCDVQRGERQSSVVT